MFSRRDSAFFKLPLSLLALRQRLNTRKIGQTRTDVPKPSTRPVVLTLECVGLVKTDRHLTAPGSLIRQIRGPEVAFLKSFQVALMLLV